jgi:hypothetical protein
MYRTALMPAAHRDLLTPGEPAWAGREFAEEITALGRVLGRVANLARAPAPR